MKTYRLSTATGDRYGGEWPALPDACQQFGLILKTGPANGAAWIAPYRERFKRSDQLCVPGVGCGEVSSAEAGYTGNNGRPISVGVNWQNHSCEVSCRIR